jgi:hypothetical protein
VFKPTFACIQVKIELHWPAADSRMYNGLGATIATTTFTQATQTQKATVLIQDHTAIYTVCIVRTVVNAYLCRFIRILFLLNFAVLLYVTIIDYERMLVGLFAHDYQRTILLAYQVIGLIQAHVIFIDIEVFLIVQRSFAAAIIENRREKAHLVCVLFC